MVSWRDARPWRAALVGLAIAAWPLLVPGLPASAFRQDPDCEPGGGGCALSFDAPISAALASSDEAHLWWLAVRVAGSFRLELTQLPADFRLYVYGPDGTLMGQSNNPARQDEVLDVPADVVGSYAVFVDSPTGEVSGDPYVLKAVWTGVDPLPTSPVAGLPTPTPVIAVATPTPILAVDPTPAPADPIPPMDVPTPEERERLPSPSPAPVRLTPTAVPATIGPTAAVPPTGAGPAGVPATCTEPELTLQRPAIATDEFLGWEAHGFKPGTTVRAQVFADGTRAASPAVVTAVNSECIAGLRSGDEVVVTAVARARYYLLRVAGTKYGTDQPLTLIARFNVYTTAR